MAKLAWPQNQLGGPVARRFGMVLVIGALPLASDRVFAEATTLLGLQSSAPIVGQTTGMTSLPSLPNFGPTLNGVPQRHYTAAKVPCITVKAYSRAQIVNPRVFDNLLAITNDCSDTITLEACYYQKKGCLTVKLQGYSRREVILGIETNKEFRYEYREIFL